MSDRFSALLRFYGKLGAGARSLKRSCLVSGVIVFVLFEVRSFCVEELSVDLDRYEDFLI